MRSGNLPEDHISTKGEQYRLLQEVDSQGQAGELSSIPSAEVDLYGRRGFEDSTRGQALDPRGI